MSVKFQGDYSILSSLTVQKLTLLHDSFFQKITDKEPAEN